MNDFHFISIVSLHDKRSEIREIFNTYRVPRISTAKKGEGLGCSSNWACDLYPSINVYYYEYGEAKIQDAYELCEFNFLKNFYDGNWFTISHHHSLVKKVHYTTDPNEFTGNYQNFGFTIAFGTPKPDRTAVFDDREKIAY